MVGTNGGTPREIGAAALDATLDELHDDDDGGDDDAFALLVTARTPGELDALSGAGRRHRRLLARRCAGIAVVIPDATGGAAAQAAARALAGTLPCPLTVLADEPAARGWLAGQLAVGPRGARVAGSSRTVAVTPWLQDYIDAHRNPPPDPVYARLAAATRERFDAASTMNVGEDQGRLLALIAGLSRARHAVEVGTFTGASALWLARGLGPGGRLTCYEVDPRPIEVARAAWAEAGVAGRIDVVLGPALETLAARPATPPIDLAFVDADKERYGDYLDLLLPRLSPGGVIMVDNTLWSGAVADPRRDDEQTRAIRAFNDSLAARDDLDVLLLPIGDGLTIVRPRTG